MKKLTNFCVAILLCPLLTFAQLSEGDILVTGFNSEGKPNVANTYDGISFVTLADIPINTEIYISENEWENTSASFWNYNECVVKWTATSTLSAGTVVIIRFRSVVNIYDNTAQPIANVGSAAWSYTQSAGFNVSADYNNGTEVIYFYLGTNYDAPTTFLTAYANNNFSYLNGELPMTLDTETSAVEFTADKDLGVYAGYSTWSGSDELLDLKCSITDTDNWTQDDGSGEQDLDGMNTDFPTDVIPQFLGTITSLPVEIIHFIGKVKDRRVSLNWKTASEQNNDYFKLERSQDGTSFETIAIIKGQGTTSERSDYEYIDKEALLASTYYRLVQYDFDGGFEISAAIVVDKQFRVPKFQCTKLETKLHFYFENQIEQVIELHCYDTMGRFFYKDSIGIGEQNYEFDIQNLPKGTYCLKVGAEAFIFVK